MYMKISYSRGCVPLEIIEVSSCIGDAQENETIYS